MALDWAAARRAWITYRSLGIGTRALLLARLAVAPLGPMDAELRSLRGRILSLGTGHGVVDRYIVEINPDVMIEGVDLDADRVAMAQATAHPRVHVAVADITRHDPGDGYDAALAIDVLHHVPFESHADIATALHRALKPGATCLIKDMAPEPRRQYLWNRAHDRIVAGPEPIFCRTPDDMAALLAYAGFRIDDVRRLKRLRIYPQYLVLARKRA